MSDEITRFVEHNVYETLSTTDRTPCPCSSCGKDMRDPETGAVSVGMTVDNAQATGEFLTRQLGRFAGKSYSFCWECWLEASMPPVPHAAGLAGEGKS